MAWLRGTCLGMATYQNILNLFNISMMLNKCIIRWFWVYVTTKAQKIDGYKLEWKKHKLNCKSLLLKRVQNMDQAGISIKYIRAMPKYWATTRLLFEAYCKFHNTYNNWLISGTIVTSSLRNNHLNTTFLFLPSDELLADHLTFL